MSTHQTASAVLTAKPRGPGRAARRRTGRRAPRVGRRAIVRWHGGEPRDLGAGAPADQEGVEAGDADAALHAARGAAAVDVLRLVGRGLLHTLHRGELDRLVLRDRARGGVA